MIKILMAEKAGQHLKTEYFEVENGVSVRFFINEEFVKEETYEGKSVHWGQSVAENWLNGVQTLNG
jgi:hypothetical protein